MPNNKKPSAERRRFERIRVDIKVRWEGVLEQKEGTLVDLSINGCFILTSHQVDAGELIRLEMENSLLVWGEVIYQIAEMGFGLRFTTAIGEEGLQLAKLIEEQKQRNLGAK